MEKKIDISSRDIYQQVYSEGEKIAGGARSDKRLKMIPWDLFADKKVLDLGCNNGMLAIESARRGASYVLGVEMSKAAIMAREIISSEKLTNIDIWQLSIESSEFLNFTNIRFNIVFFCAMLNHMKNKQKILEWIDIHCNDILIYETNFENKPEKHIDFVIKYTSFTGYKFLGRSGDRKPEDYNLYMFRRNTHEQGGKYDEVDVVFIPVSMLRLGVMDVEKFKNKGEDKFISERNKVDRLKENIKNNGLREALWISERKDGLYQITEGGHRFLALKELGYKDIPVRIIRRAA